MQTVKPFAEPRHTQFSNIVIDYIMPSVSPSTWMVITIIMRETIGKRVEKVKLSLADFEKKTHLSRPTVITAVAQALDLGVLIREKHGRGYLYQLNQELEIVIDTPEKDSKEILPIPPDKDSKETLPPPEKDSKKSLQEPLPLTKPNNGIKESFKDNNKQVKTIKPSRGFNPPNPPKFTLKKKWAEELETNFCKVSKVAPPDWSDKPKGTYVKWREPFKVMLKKAIYAQKLVDNPDTEPNGFKPKTDDVTDQILKLVKELNRNAILEMKKEGLTISSPKSIVSNFSSLLARYVDTGSVGRGASETDRKRREEQILESMEKYQ